MAVTKGHPMYCAKQARRTPIIPTHNGYPNCLRCGADVAAIVREQRGTPDAHHDQGRLRDPR